MYFRRTSTNGYS